MHDQSIFPFYLAVSILVVVLVSIIILSFGISIKRKLANRRERERMIVAQERELVLARTEEQERIRSLISAEMHDHMGQVLSVIQMNLDYLKRHNERELLNERIDNLRHITAGLAGDVQNMSHLLNKDYIKGRGLADSLSQEVAYIRSARPIECVFDVKGEIMQLPPDKELMIFRIAQEALHNAIKHARPSRLTVTLSFGERVKLTVCDNGVGFDPKTADGAKGAGLNNMKSRASVLNGVIDVRSSPGAGCCVELRV